MVRLVLIRHGESEANFSNTYTGWSDVPLTEKGHRQAAAAGQALAKEGVDFAAVHTSLLSRAIQTAYIVQDAIHQNWLPIRKTWRLNERHYGALRGINKDLTRELFGPEQVALWRRSYTAVPPLLTTVEQTRRYRNLPRTALSRGESLADATNRLLPYWNEVLVPALRAGQNQLVVAHGSSLRALIKVLEAIPDQDIDSLEVGNAQPLCYALDARLSILEKKILPVEKV